MNDINVLLQQTGLGTELSLTGSLLQLSLALILNLGLALLYNYLNKERKKNHQMMHSIVYIGLIMAGAMLLIASNPIVAVGLFGAVSIVRFRTAVQNPIDMSFLFLCVVVGISCGLGFMAHAVMITLFVGTVIYLFHLFRLGMSGEKATLSAEGDCIISITVDREVFTPALIHSLKSQLTLDDRMVEVKSRKKKISLKISRPAMDLDEVQELNAVLEPYYREDPGFELAVLRA